MRPIEVSGSAPASRQGIRWARSRRPGPHAALDLRRSTGAGRSVQLLHQRALVGDSPVLPDAAVAQPFNLHLPDVDRAARRCHAEERACVPADGTEWVKSFAREGEAFACPVALAGGQTTFATVAIEPSIVEIIGWHSVEALGAADLSWQRAIRFAYQRLAERKVRRERDLLTLTAEELYRQFAASAPELMRRVSQKDLGAYLGVTAVGLNRIVKRVRLSRG